MATSMPGPAPPRGRTARSLLAKITNSTSLRRCAGARHKACACTGKRRSPVPLRGRAARRITDGHFMPGSAPPRGRTVRSDHVLQHKTLMGFVARACGAKAGLVEPGRVPECAARRGADGAQGDVTAGGGGEAGKRAEGGGAIRGAGRTGPGKRREKRARGAGRSILREGRGKGRDSVAKYGEKVSEGGGTSAPAGEKGSGGGA